MILLRSGKKSKVDLYKELNKSCSIITDLLLIKFIYYPATNVISATDEHGIMLTKNDCLKIFVEAGFTSIRDVFNKYKSDIEYKMGYCVLNLYICYVNE